MGQDSKIEWTSHSFNPWRGCTKVSPGCANCYAETLSKRWGHDIWGVNKPRIVASESYWRQPLKWNRDAKEAGERRRVFCASVADVFEDYETMPQDAWEDIDMARERLWMLIDDTPHLDWLLLTKRPENIRRFFPVNREWANVWLGTSVEDQRRANERIPNLLAAPVSVRFLSCEPLLGGLDLRAIHRNDGGNWDVLRGIDTAAQCHLASRIDWVIVGGESGANARPMHPDWARSLRDQCSVAGVPFFMKQWGEWLPESQAHILDDEAQINILCGKPDFQTVAVSSNPDPKGSGSRECAFRVGKKAAGRRLDGREWNEYPQPR